MISQFITENRAKPLSLKKTCFVFSVSPSGYFKSLKLKKQQVQNNRKKEEIAKAFRLHKGRYGYRKVFHYLSGKKGFSGSSSQVRHTLKKYGLRARKSKLFKSITTQSDKSSSTGVRVFKVGETVLTGVNQGLGK